MEKPLAEFTINCIEELCLQKFPSSEKKQIIGDLCRRAKINKETELERRQFNEILLLCNETRVSEDFFNYFTKGEGKLTVHDLPKLIDQLKKHSMLQFGNFKFALNNLIKSRNIENDLGNWIRDPEKIIQEFSTRPKQIMEIQKIPRNKVHHLGYLIKDKDNEVLKKGEFNTKVYLTSDYMDVYVATSMRGELDFHSVFDLCKAVFSRPKIKNLNLRYFDPTQSYHKNRIAKGLIEGLMLKRAKCTIYAAEESDSFGKDSELAATLAQGKPVIAFIPKFNPNDKKYLDSLYKLPLIKVLDKAMICIQEVSVQHWKLFEAFLTAIENYLKDIEKKLAKENQKILKDEDQLKKTIRIRERKFEDFIQIVANAEAAFYDKRTDVLHKLHPLGFQINLESGVANGVLISRDYNQCAEILYDILTNQLEFDLIKPGEINKKEGYPKDDLNYLLCEKKSKSAFRVITKDDLITNSFWNFYLEREK